MPIIQTLTNTQIHKLYNSNFVTGITKEQTFKLKKIYDKQPEENLRLEVLSVYQGNKVACRILLLPLNEGVYLSLLNQNINKREFLSGLLSYNITKAHTTSKYSSTQGIVLAIGAVSKDIAVKAIKFEQKEYDMQWLPIRNSGMLHLVKPHEGYKLPTETTSTSSIKNMFDDKLDNIFLIISVILALSYVTIYIHLFIAVVGNLLGFLNQDPIIFRTELITLATMSLILIMIIKSQD